MSRNDQISKLALYTGLINSLGLRLDLKWNVYTAKFQFQEKPKT